MVRKIIWSQRAQEDRIRILTYWKDRNKSSAYSKKLNLLFKAAVKLIVDHPEIGKPSDLANVRVKIIREYLMIYEIKESAICILTIWDSRQDPQFRVVNF